MADVTVLYYEVGKGPQSRIIPDELEAMRALVGGDIELVHLFDNVGLICNEEGKLLGLPPNRRFPADTIVGNFFVTAHLEGEMVSLTDEQVSEVLSIFEGRG